MRVAFLTNYLNHHQKPLADEFYRLLGNGNYFFIETTGVPDFRIKLGYKEMTAPYVLKYNKEIYKQVEDIINNFDVIIFSNAPLSLFKRRYREGKLTFYYSERRYKTLSRYLYYPVYTYRSFYINKGYLLCASAYTPIDYFISGMPLNKCFRWGYFPEVKEYDNLNSIINKKNTSYNSAINILWVGRLIKWKHPEAPLNLAYSLKQEGYSFTLDIVGNGELDSFLKKHIEEKHLGDCVHMHGGMSPTEVRNYMECADIFIFTSDRQEGWGAVLNESLNSACAVVANNAIGSVPYLIQNGENGMIYQSGSVIELTQKVKFLIDNPYERFKMQELAYYTMQKQWNAKCAANNFISLVESIQNGLSNPITVGPCSQAPLLFDYIL